MNAVAITLRVMSPYLPSGANLKGPSVFGRHNVFKALTIQLYSSDSW